MSVLSRSCMRCAWSALPRSPRLIQAVTLKPTRHASDSIISCVSVNVPRLTPLPTAAFVVSGGTLLSQNVHQQVHTCGDGGPEHPAAEFVKLVSLLSDLLKTTVAKEPERPELLSSVLHAICSLDVLPTHPDLIEALSRPCLGNELCGVDKDTLHALIVKVWLAVPDATSAAYMHMAANLLLETRGRLPSEIVNIVNDPGFVEVVGQLGALDVTVVTANIALLAAMERVPRPSLNAAVVTAIMRNLGVQLMQVPPPRDERTATRLVAVAKAVTHVAIFDEEFLLAYAVKMLEMARTLGGRKVFNPFASLSAVAHVLYALSRASIPCLALLEELQEHVSPADYRSVRPELLLHLLWAHLAQGVAPPRAACACLDLCVRELTPATVLACGEELEQLRPHLSAASRQLVGELLRRHRPIASTVFHDAALRHPELAAGVESDEAGCVHLCALVNPAHGEFIPWPRASVEPDVMSADFAAALPGVPVAVLPCYQGDVLAPRRRLAGPTYRKLLLLESLGWHVLVVDMTQHWSSRKSNVLALVARIRSFGRSMRAV